MTDITIFAEDDFSGYETVNEWTRYPPRHDARAMLQTIGWEDDAELETAMQRALDACLAMNIPVELHFHRVYFAGGESITTDWQLSDLGFYLLLLNGNPKRASIAEAQLYFLKRLLHH